MAKVLTKKNLEFNGIPELIAKIRRLSVRLKEDGTTVQDTKRAFMAGVLPIRDYARSIAPVGPSRMIKGRLVKGGAFRDSIFAAYGPPQYPNVLLGCNYRIAPHAWIVEFGSSRTAPHHTMRSAIVSKRVQATATIAEGMRAVIERAAERA